MKSFFIEKEIELNSQRFTQKWLSKTFDLPQESIVAFSGPMRVSMSGVEEGSDVRDLECDRMLHFIIKQKRMVKRELVLQMYFFISLITNILGKGFKREQTTILYKGLPLSISAIRYYKDMSLIHAGLFVKEESYKRPSIGLEALQILEKDLALDVLFQYSKHIKDMKELASFIKLST